MAGHVPSPTSCNSNANVDTSRACQRKLGVGRIRCCRTEESGAAVSGVCGEVQCVASRVVAALVCIYSPEVNADKHRFITDGCRVRIRARLCSLDATIRWCMSRLDGRTVGKDCHLTRKLLLFLINEQPFGSSASSALIP
jgi:hypothetical protein